MPSTPQQTLLAQLRQQGIHSPRILQALTNVARDSFVPTEEQERAWLNQPLSIGYQQTISQPYIVARMTQLLLEGREAMAKVLEIGTGSGYQAAVLAQLVEKVYTVERIRPLWQSARQRLRQLGLSNIFTHYSDGQSGWPQHAPYDGIIVTAASRDIPPALREQMAEGGRLVIPIGKADTHHQQLLRLTRAGTDFHTETFDAVIFVPLLAGTRPS